MKTPPVVNTETKNDSYLMGDKVMYGFPSRTYFELYDGSCKSKKLYSVQTKHMPKDVAAVVYDPKHNLNIDKEDFRKGSPVGRDHVFVEYTEDLIELLKRHGIETKVVYHDDVSNKSAGMSTKKNSAWVNPSAFTWISADSEDIDIEPGDADIYVDTDSKKTGKAIVMALIAALSLLN